MIPIISDLQNRGNWNFSEFVIGDMLVLLSGFFYCLDTFIAKKIDRSVSTRKIVHIMFCTGALMMLFLMVLFDISFYISLKEFTIISIVGFLGIGVTMLFFVIALRLIGSVRAVMIYSTSLIFSVMYSVTYLAETLTINNILSVGIVLFGLYLLRKKLGSD